MPATPTRGNRYPAQDGSDAYFPHVDIKKLADDLDLVADTYHGTLDARPPTPSKPTIYVVLGDPTPTNNGIAWYWDGDSWEAITPAPAPESVERGWFVPGVLRLPAGGVSATPDDDYLLPLRFRVPTGTTLKIESIYTNLTGSAGETATVNLYRAPYGSGWTLLQQFVVALSPAEVLLAGLNGGAGWTVADKDQFRIALAALNGTPANLTFQIEAVRRRA